MAQRAFVLFHSEDHSNIGELNNLLAQGMRVKRASAMSGTGETGPETPQSAFPYSRAAVVLSDESGREQQHLFCGSATPQAPVSLNSMPCSHRAGTWHNCFR